MRRKKVAIIGTTGLPAKYGGFETLAHHLTRLLNSEYELTVYCSSKYFANKKKRRKAFNESKLIYIPLNANGYQSIFYDVISIIHALIYADALLVLGVSGSILFPFIKMFSSKPVIVNIDGQEWKRPKWNWIVRKYLRFSERLAIRYSDTVIADNKAIRDYVVREYEMEPSLIEYGGDHVTKEEITKELQTKYSFLSKPYAFTVCRIEPENNVHLILEAFSQLPEKTLVVVGLWNHGKFGMELRKKYSGVENIFMIDPIYDQQELNTLRSNAALYLHGHSAGGTNPSLVEAMCLGLPVISFDVSYNRETTRNNALYFRNVKELVQTLSTITEEQRLMQAAQMKLLGESRYTWSRIASAYRREVEILTGEAIIKLTAYASGKSENFIDVYFARQQEKEIA